MKILEKYDLCFDTSSLLKTKFDVCKRFLMFQKLILSKLKAENLWLTFHFFTFTLTQLDSLSFRI